MKRPLVLWPQVGMSQPQKGECVNEPFAADAGGLAEQDRECRAQRADVRKPFGTKFHILLSLQSDQARHKRASISGQIQ